MIQSLSDALAERGYADLTPVQAAVTDPALRDADLLVSAQTGSGKTVGFGLAIGPTLLGEDEAFGPAAAPLALIVAPTRELAFQVTRELGWLYAKTGARLASCVGGMDMRDERRALERGAHIVVGTPGRLTDHIRRGSLDMGSLRVIVLDEADEMLDLGFREDLEFMLAEAPVERRTLMFSATVPPMIATLAQYYQRDAVRVTTLAEKGQHADIAYQVLQVAPQDVENAIINVLRFHEAQNALVFANTRASVNRLTARFANRGFAVVSLSGELSQSERTHALQAMRDGRARVCVATDVAARGIDLPSLDLVVHAELPTNVETLLHRSGRTGRAGRKGLSALVVPPSAAKKAERLLRSARVTAEWTTAPGADEIRRRDEERLLSHPAWSDELAEDEAVFAERLLAQHSPQAIAAACLRFYRAQHSAPEELGDPAARAPARERAPFGPSAWFTLSVGRDDRAEARWLLPLLCRAGRIGKDDIGAIRVQQAETFVELTEASVPGFLAALGADGLLENGITARRIEGTPDMARAAAPSGPTPRPRAKRAETRPESAPAPEAVAAPVAAPVVPPVQDAVRVEAAPVPEAAPPTAAPPAAPSTPAPETPRPKSGEAAAPRTKERWSKDRAKEHGSKDRGPKERGTKEHGPKYRGESDRAPKDRGTVDRRGGTRTDFPKRAGSSEAPRRQGGDETPRKKTFGKPYQRADSDVPGKPKPRYGKGPNPSRPAREVERPNAADTSRRFDPKQRSAAAPSPGRGPDRAGPGGKGPGGKGPGGKPPGGKGPGGKTFGGKGPGGKTFGGKGKPRSGPPPKGRKD
jgi:ATP-dependent RNA helicase DeaD